MKYLVLTLVSLVVCLSTNAATYYIDYQNGSDSNDGSSKSSAWKRAPGMKGFKRSYRHVAGDRFIFKGGVTWPADALQMRIDVGGSNDSNRDYYGVDKSWFAGSSWTRPTFDAGRQRLGGGTGGAIIFVTDAKFITIEGIEFTGLVALSSDFGAMCISVYGPVDYLTIKDCLFRDWLVTKSTGVPYVSTDVTGWDNNGVGGVGTFGGGYGGNILVTHCVAHQNGVVQKSGSSYRNVPTVAFSEAYATTQGVLGGHSVINCKIHDFPPPTDPTGHCNAIEIFGPSYIFGNLIYNLSNETSPIAAAADWGNPGASTSTYILNNVLWNVGWQSPIALHTGGDPSNSSFYIWNNTVEHDAWAIRTAFRAAKPYGYVEIKNNHFITSQHKGYNFTPPTGGLVNKVVESNNLLQSLKSANQAGYSVGNLFQPTSANSPTIGIGVDLSARFSRDRLGVVRSGAWDVGAYEYSPGSAPIIDLGTIVGGIIGGGNDSGGSSGGPVGTLELDSDSFTVSETAGSVTVTIRRKDGSNGRIGGEYGTVNWTAGEGVNYSATSGTLVWADGDTTERKVTIPILNANMTGAKAFTFTLYSATGGASLGSPSSATVKITGAGGAPTVPSTPNTPTTPGQPENLFTNPSFESGLDGWTATGNQGIAGASPYQAADGGKLVAFNWGQEKPNAVLSRTFTTIPGQAYTLTFEVGVLAYNRDEQKLSVQVIGDGKLVNQVITVVGNGGGTTTWKPQSFDFVANSTSTTLRFEDVSAATVNLDLLLDDVQVTTTYGSLSTSQPESKTVNPGDSVTFSVVATGPGNLSYQWRFKGAHIANANQSSYTIQNVQAGHAGDYDVVISNGSASVTSSAATLSVVEAISFTNGSFESGYDGWTQSGFQNVVANSLYKSSDGNKLVAFNWGQTSPNGVLSQTFTTLPGQGYVLNFDAGTLAFKANEQRLRVTVSGDVTLLSKTISLTGVPNGQTKWNPQSFSFVADSSTTTLTFRDDSPTSQDLDLLLDNVRINPQGGVPQAPAPQTPLAIVTQPEHVAAVVGGSATLSVVATGPGSLTYQWRFNSTPIAGAVGSAYTINNVQPANAGTYDVIVSANGTSVTSSAALVTVPQLLNFTNGSFESGYSGWVSSGNLRILSTPLYPATDGSALLVFNSGDMPPNGTVSQTFTATVGKTYRITCNVGVLAYNNNQQKLRVDIAGATRAVSDTFSVFGAGRGAMRWTPQVVTFVASSPLVTVAFRDVSEFTQGLDLLLDNVQVIQTN